MLVRDALALAVGLIMTSVHVNFQLRCVCALVRQEELSVCKFGMKLVDVMRCLR